MAEPAPGRDAGLVRYAPPGGPFTVTSVERIDDALFVSMFRLRQERVTSDGEVLFRSGDSFTVKIPVDLVQEVLRQATKGA